VNGRGAGLWLLMAAAVLGAPGRSWGGPAAGEPLGAEIYLDARRAMSAGRWDDAVRDFQTLVTVNSSLADYARYWQAVCYIEQGRRAAAVDAFLSVTEDYPDSAVCPHARVALGDIHASTGAREHAVEMYRAALAQVPSSIDTGYARLRLAKVLADSGETGRACAELRLAPSPGRNPPQYFREMVTFMQTSPEDQDRLLAAQWLFDAGDYAAAAAGCRHLIESDDLPVNVHRQAALLRGRSLARDGRLDESAGVLHGVTVDFAGSVEASQALLEEAATYRKMGQTGRFVTLIEQLARKYPNSRAAETGVLTVAKAYDGWSRYEQAQVWYKRFADTYSWSWAMSDALYRRAVLAIVSGAQRDTAVDLFRDVVAGARSAETLAGAHYWLGTLRLAAGDTHGAASSFSAAVRHRPYSYYGLHARGALARLSAEGTSVPASALRLSKTCILLAPQPGIVLPQGIASGADEPIPRVGRLPTRPGTLDRIAVARLLAREGLEEADWEIEALSARFGRPEDKWALAWTLHDAGAHGRAMRVAETLDARGGAAGGRMKLVYPTAYWTSVRDASARFGVDAFLVESFMREESRFMADDISTAGAIGLMQLMPATARWAAEQARIEGYAADRTGDPEINIALGTWYIRHLLDTFDGDIVCAIAAYNAGPGNVAKWFRARGGTPGDIDRFIESIPFEETRGYVKRVLRSYAAYKMLYR